MPFIITNSFKPDINREYPPSLHAPSNPFNYNLTDTGRKWVVNLIRRAQYGARPMKLPPVSPKRKSWGKKWETHRRLRKLSTTFQAYLWHIPQLCCFPEDYAQSWLQTFPGPKSRGAVEGGIYIQRNIRSHDRPPSHTHTLSRLWSRGRTIYYPGQLSNRSVNPCFTTWNRSWIQFSRLVFS